MIFNPSVLVCFGDWICIKSRRLAIAFSYLVAVFGSLGGHLSAADDDKVGNLQFENSIRPVLIEHCVGCHGPGKAENGLRLDSRSGLLIGGESGTAVDLDAPHNSLLLSALRHESLEMPPNKRLPDVVLEEFETWLSRKAPWPEYASSIALEQGPDARVAQGRSYWAFQPLREVSGHLGRTPSEWLDLQVELGIASNGLTPAPLASEFTLFRRVYVDVLGSVPTWEDWVRYRDDPSEPRYERLVDTLLADSRYGEHWAQFWLDLVRFAESDGFKQDAFRPSAYLYRDWVIQSLNEDKPYGQFVREQLAGDLLAPVTDGSRIATGFLRHWIYEYNQRDVASQRENILNDLTEVTSEVFLGLSIGCARCHDHKFDPLLQEDYYRLQACFAATLPCDDYPSSMEADRLWRSGWRLEQIQEVEQLTKELAELESSVRHDVTEQWIEKFPPEIRPALRKPSEERTTREAQIAYLSQLQIDNELATMDMIKRLPEDKRERWKACKTRIDEIQKVHGNPPPRVMSVVELTNPSELNHPLTKRIQGGLKPSVPKVLEHYGSDIVDRLHRNESDRRLQLASWISDRKHPLTWRVIVNRVWQQYFGQGLVSNTSDVGSLSDPPTHPELLDGLAAMFIQHGESLKELHRWILMSNTYRRASQVQDGLSDAGDPKQLRFLAKFPRKRLTAEQLRDSILMISGELDSRMSGPSDELNSSRRSIYLKVLRNSPHPLLAAFDRPDGNAMVAKRNTTTTPLQALALINANWPQEMARQLVDRCCQQDWSLERCVVEIFRRVYLRDPESWELESAITFQREGLADLCHVLLCSSEFLYVQ